MQGRKVYEFALKNVPVAMKSCFDEADCKIEDLKRYLFIRLTRKWMRLL